MSEILLQEYHNRLGDTKRRLSKKGFHPDLSVDFFIYIFDITAIGCGLIAWPAWLLDQGRFFKVTRLHSPDVALKPRLPVGSDIMSNPRQSHAAQAVVGSKGCGQTDFTQRRQVGDTDQLPV